MLHNFMWQWINTYQLSNGWHFDNLRIDIDNLSTINKVKGQRCLKIPCDTPLNVIMSDYIHFQNVYIITSRELIQTLFPREMSQHQGQWPRVLKHACCTTNEVVRYYIQFYQTAGFYTSWELTCIFQNQCHRSRMFKDFMLLNLMQ